MRHLIVYKRKINVNNTKTFIHLRSNFRSSLLCPKFAPKDQRDESRETGKKKNTSTLNSLRNKQIFKIICAQFMGLKLTFCDHKLFRCLFSVQSSKINKFEEQTSSKMTLPGVCPIVYRYLQFLYQICVVSILHNRTRPRSA